MQTTAHNASFARPDHFLRRHLGPSPAEQDAMLEALGFGSFEELVAKTVPRDIRLERDLELPPPRTEDEVLDVARQLAERNEVWRSYIGAGYHGTLTPTVIQRNILENPGWYTQYTPYQSEIAQGRLEALFNFQTMVAELSGLEVANGSLLDEATAAAEAMSMCLRVNRKNKSRTFFVSELCHPQTIEVVRTRAEPLGMEIVVGDHEALDRQEEFAGVLLQYPATDGRILDYRQVVEQAHARDALVIVAADILALTLLTPPGDWGADVVVGNTQRFGVPFGFGGPHAAFMATREDYKRQIPGRIVGQSLDADGNPALRLALQTREQHIRRERATSNICTAQVLLAVMASMYGVYHGPDGLRRIAGRVRDMTVLLDRGLGALGLPRATAPFFDTLTVELGERAEAVLAAAEGMRINLRPMGEGRVAVSLDETVGREDLEDLLYVFAGGEDVEVDVDDLTEEAIEPLPGDFARTSDYMRQPVFNAYHSETEFLRYVYRLQQKDLSLTTSMIPLGSCTMKLNATTEMLPVTWPGFSDIHPFAPLSQARGYTALFEQLESWLAEITGMAATSLQPNAGSQGEYAGMLVIRAYHEERGEGHRDVCLIPASAHGTNPASAVMAGMKVVVVASDEMGNIDVGDLEKKIDAHRDRLAAIMVTYPSTHGVFERGIRRICELVHGAGGQVYLDGANMNAQVGLCRPGDYGADVCHLNLHKTFCIPHGGGGPGMGPICVAEHLAPYLPTHPLQKVGGEHGVGAVSAAPWGSPSILPISWAYIAMLGAEGLRRATEVAILNANYMVKRLEGHYDILFRGPEGQVAHEFIIDLRPFKEQADVEVEDVAKRLMDYGFHAPTVSWPVAGTMMVEPTESESKAELDRFCDALLAIHAEVKAIAEGELDREDNPLKRAPHTAAVVTADAWDRPYSRQQAAFPADWLRAHKFWPPTSRVDNAYGDRNLVCACPPTSDWAE